MASLFKTKVAMLKIIDDFTNKLKSVGYAVLKSKNYKDIGQQMLYIGNDYIGDIYFSYSKSNREMRSIVTRFYEEVKLYHTVEYREDNVTEEYRISVRDNSCNYLTENELYKLDETYEKLCKLYRNYKMANDKVKEMKMITDFS